MEDKFKRFFVLRSEKMIFSFLIKTSRLKAIEIEIAFFSFPWESQWSHGGSFLLCFAYPSYFPPQTDTYIEESLEIFLKLSMKTVQLHLRLLTHVGFFSTKWSDTFRSFSWMWRGAGIIKKKQKTS